MRQPAVQRLHNCTTGEVLAERISRATAPWQRVIGYLARRAVETGEGLWFDRCSLVHTLGMRATIDVIFVDCDQLVVRIVSRARRNRIFHGGSRAAAVVELAPGFAQSHRVAVGDRLRLE